MKVALFVTKSVEENAEMYFKEAKKARKKILGVKKTIHEFEGKKDSLQDDAQTQNFVSQIQRVTDSHSFWFEKFRWTISSEGFLLIGGRDATTNEIVIKKHTDKDDVVLHTDMAGSPFVVVKKNRQEINELFQLPSINPETEATDLQQTILEAGSFVLDYAKAWKMGFGMAKVFFVSPEQVTKEANPGEYLPKGAFMIRGKTTYVDAQISFGLGIIHTKDKEKTLVMGGPMSAVQTHCKEVIEIVQGGDKASVVAKQVRQFFLKEQDVDISLDAIIRVLPPGGCQVKKIRKRKKDL